MSFGPSRGGTRGGQDRFTWDDVKGDKYKEFYLGQSLKLRPSWFSQEMEGKKKEAAAVVDKVRTHVMSATRCTSLDETRCISKH